MLDQAIRTAILELRRQGHGTRTIADALGISRWAVREVLRAGTAAVPRVQRAEKAEPFEDDILELHARCNGNLVRVHEELCAQGAVLSYQALTSFCRRRGIGHEPKRPAGQYHFEPGEEMQHDTSPHLADIAGAKVKVQTASLALCFSRMLFFQLYLRFTRFICKVFLTEALKFFGGAAGRCVIDNTPQPSRTSRRSSLRGEGGAELRSPPPEIVTTNTTPFERGRGEIRSCRRRSRFVQRPPVRGPRAHPREDGGVARLPCGVPPDGGALLPLFLIVTAAAGMICQENAALVTAAKHYLFALKGNQEHLHALAQEWLLPGATRPRVYTSEKRGGVRVDREQYSLMVRDAPEVDFPGVQ